MTIPAPPTSVTRNGGSIPLTADEQRQIQRESGKLIADQVAAEIRTRSFQALSEADRGRMLSRIVTTTRTQAQNALVSALPKDEYERRRAGGQPTSVKRPLPRP